MPSKTQMERSFGEMIRPFKGAVVTTGSTFYVDSTTGSDATGRGRSKEKPTATIDYAYNLCTTGLGDTIYVMPGHAETISAATSLVLDTAGVNVIGLGQGSDRPTLSISAAAAYIDISGNDNVFKNFLVTNTTSAIASCFIVSGTNTLIEDVEIRESSTANLFTIEGIRIGVANNDADHSTIRNCKFYSADVDHENDILIMKDQIGLTIEGNWCQGNYSVGTVDGAIAADSAENCTNVLVKDNVVISAATDQAIAINLDGPSNTGMLIGNYASAPDADWTPFVAVGCGFHENYGSGSLASSGYLYPGVDS